MKVVRFVSQVLIWLLLLSATGAVAVAVVIPRIAGATPYTVLTGSMEPKYPPGTLVVVKPTPAKQIRIGDVVTYQLESGKPTVVTHRVISVGTRLDGKLSFTTQGDANDVPDPIDVQAVQIQGRLWYSVPYLGHVNNVFTGRQRQTLVLVASAGLIGYATFMFVGTIRDRRRKKSQVVREAAFQPPYETQEAEQDKREEEPRDRSAAFGPDTRDLLNARNAAIAVGGIVVLGLTYCLIKARRGRSSGQPN